MGFFFQKNKVGTQFSEMKLEVCPRRRDFFLQRPLSLSCPHPVEHELIQRKRIPPPTFFWGLFFPVHDPWESPKQHVGNIKPTIDLFPLKIPEKEVATGGTKEEKLRRWAKVRYLLESASRELCFATFWNEWKTSSLLILYVCFQK